MKFAWIINTEDSEPKTCEEFSKDRKEEQQFRKPKSLKSSEVAKMSNWVVHSN